ncbi:MAG: LamG domain-containing protein, partial [Lentisphaerota bacterium]
SAKVDFFAIGSGVGYFDGTGDYLSIPASSDFDFGTAPYTLETYVRWSVVGTSVLFDEAADKWKIRYQGGHLYFENGSAPWNDVTFTPVANTWYHIASTRGATNALTFINGTLSDTDANSTNITSTGQINIAIDASGNNGLNGRLDNVRVSKGIARYQATFNPPEDYSNARPEGMLAVF